MFGKPRSTGSILRNTTAIDMMGIASLWCMTLFLVYPIGDFPLNDDWSFGLTVKHLLESADFRPGGWAGMPLLSNALWGALFCIPFGFSFTALRISTIMLSLVGVLSVYALGRELHQPRWLAIIVALVVAFNPVYYALSNTFMTDVPYTAMAVLAALFLARALRRDSTFDLLIGSSYAVLATLSRQLAISVPLAFAVSLVLTRGLAWRHLLRAAIPPTLSLGALLGFQKWLELSGRLPAQYHGKAQRLVEVLSDPRMLITSLGANINIALLYLGLFLFPVLMFVAAAALRVHKRRIILFLSLAVGMLALVNGVRFLYGRNVLLPLPTLGNILVRSGIGPLTLRDVSILRLDHVPGLPSAFWLTATLMGLVGAGIFLAVLASEVVRATIKSLLARQIADADSVRIFLLISGAVYILPLLVSGFFDRYLIPAMPFFAAAILGSYDWISHGSFSESRFLKHAAIIILTAYAVFAIAGTKDYLAWNRVRWEALHTLTDQDGVSAAHIDGGFEFNGLYLYDPAYHKEPTKSWWWVQDDTYQLSFGGLPGYKVIREKRYINWLPPRVGKVVVLERRKGCAAPEIALLEQDGSEGGCFHACDTERIPCR